MRIGAIAMLLAACAFALGAGASVRIEAVAPDLRASRPDLRPGDLLDTVIDGDASIVLDALAWRRVQVEILPLRAVRLVGRRDGRPFDIALDESAPTITVGAVTGPAPPDEVYAAEDALGRGEADAAAVLLARALGRQDIPPLLRMHALVISARLEEEAGRRPEALDMLDEAGRIAGAHAPESLAAARVELARARVLRELRRFEEAAGVAAAAADRASRRCAGCALNGEIAVEQALSKGAQGLREEAVPILRRGIEHLLAVQGPTREIAAHQVRLAGLLRGTGQLEEARQAIDRAFELQATTGVGDRELAMALRERGTIAWFVSDHAVAEAALLDALARFEALEPGGAESAKTRSNLGSMYQDQGRFWMAKGELQEVAAQWEKLATNPIEHARTLYILGTVEDDLGEFEAAIAYQRKAIALLEDGSNPRLLASVQSSLGVHLANAGRLSEASAAFDRSRQLYEGLPEECYCAAPPTRNIGWFEFARADYVRSEAAFRKSLGLFERHEGTSQDLAEGSLGVGLSLLQGGSPAEAAAPLERARREYAAAMPDSYYLGLAQHALGRVAAAAGREREAGEAYCAAVDTLDRSSELAGGNAISRSVFRSRFSAIYGDCLRYRLKLGDAAAAFVTLERYRARGLLESLSMRAPDWDKLDPKAVSGRLRALLEERADLASELPPGAVVAASGGPSRSRLQELEVLIGRELDNVRRQSPQVAMLLRPRRFEARELQAALGPGDVLLSYVVFDDETLVFRVTRGSISAHRVALGRQALRQRVDALRRQVTLISPAGDADLRTLAAGLHDALVAPLDVAPDEDGVLFLSLDGPLHGLPFAMLWNTARGAYLIEERPLKQVDSLSIALQRTRVARAAAQGGLLAVADPVLPPQAEASHLPPLPGARREIGEIARVVGEPVIALEGVDATEASATRLAVQAERIHFATHGVFDARRPLDSMLVLGAASERAGPEQDGLLHVWEIFERLDTAASMVVLSACETGLGEDLSSEGVLGFARAFQYAGAGAVVASLWRIHDEATPDFMREFHRQLDRGDAHALRGAALSLIRSDATVRRAEQRGVAGLISRGSGGLPLRHPYFWAGFQLFGDPR